MFRESLWSLIQYLTAALLLVVLGIHILTHIPPFVETYHEGLSLESVRTNYRELGWVLLILLYVALFHGLNGIRGLAHEIIRNTRMLTIVNTALVLLFIILAAYGTYTIMKWA